MSLDEALAKLQKAKFEAWDDWMHDFSDGLNEAGVDWEQLPLSPRPTTAPHGTRMADSFCMMLRERDEARAVLRDVQWSGNPERTCPMCEGFKPVNDGLPEDPGTGHTTACRVGKAIGEES